MKTEQEQTKQMLKILCDKFQCSAIDTSYMAKSCRQCEDIVEALHEAGYGDISEYKAEIEQLKAKNKVLGDGVAKAFTNGFNTGREQVEKDIRRAKIDVLNKLKEKLGDYEDHCLEMHDWQGQTAICECEEYIDELIKEIENETINNNLG